MIAKGKLNLPYEPCELKIDRKPRVDVVASLKIGIDNELDADLIERFRNYTFVPREHEEKKLVIVLISIINYNFKINFHLYFVTKKIKLNQLKLKKGIYNKKSNLLTSLVTKECDFN